MGLMNDLGSLLYGSNQVDQYNVLSPEQQALQSQLMGQIGNIAGQTMQSNYAGDYAENSLNDLLTGINRQRQEALATNRHSNRFHSSNQGMRDAKINSLFGDQVNRLKYKHDVDQQKQMQQYNQLADNYNLLGKYSAMGSLAGPALARQTENVSQQNPGLLNIAGGIAGLASLF